MQGMDRLDQRLIALLRDNARASVASLAQRLDVSRGTVSNRLARLESDGAIVGYTVRLRSDVPADQITAWMTIAVDGNQARDVMRALMGEPGVVGLCDTNGRWDMLAELRAENLTDLSGILDRIRLIKGIGSTETSIHLQTYRFSTRAAAGETDSSGTGP